MAGEFDQRPVGDQSSPSHFSGGQLLGCDQIFDGANANAQCTGALAFANQDRVNSSGLLSHADRLA